MGSAGQEPSESGENSAETYYANLRRGMVESQLRSRDITDTRVLEAMRRVPRHLFVPEADRDRAYGDHAMPIGFGQTISQPYIVALMTQLVHPLATSRALEIGTGCGYQAAVLAELVKRVYSIEIVPQLAAVARRRLLKLGYRNVEVRTGDGHGGWPEEAPFDVILVAAAPVKIPQLLIEQLARGGRLVIPVGGASQKLMVMERQADGCLRKQSVAPVAFVPMVREGPTTQ